MVEVKKNTSPSHQVGSTKKKDPMRMSSSNSGGSGKSRQSTKRRSSWRNLINPNYKSRSDEFHKIFCDTIPSNERLIADYSCALHREILIQGRVYISINYVAFYSNLFSWITKLVIRLRNVSEIYKANTARIIPNAIQIITTNGDKHVFASFVARDKSYVMLLRIWQNNLMNERMTDQAIKNLVHVNYGKDLGISDNEELNINSPDPITPANVQLESSQQENDTTQQPNNVPTSDAETSQVDGNNNSNSSSQDISSIINRTPSEKELSPKKDLSPKIESRHTRYNSFDLNSRAKRVDQNDVIAEVVSKLNELPDSYKVEDGSYSPATSSLVIVDTPPQSNQKNFPSDKNHKDAQDSFLDEDRAPDLPNRNSLGSSSTATKVAVEDLEDLTRISTDETQINPPNLNASNLSISDDRDEYRKLLVDCECEDHPGQLILDQEFDMDVDDLFSLIFTNSEFMRTYMLQRGMTDTIITGWRRSNNGGDKSNSSTLSTSDSRQSEATNYTGTPLLVRIKQVRQLNYSMSINHMWAKQVHIEERQSICQLKDGVYVLKSRTKNSGIPYGESFSVDLTYCLTRNGALNKSRMVVHGFANFYKDKQNWRLAMVKSLIERQTVQGCNDYLCDLSVCIREYLTKKEAQSNSAIMKEEQHASPLAEVLPSDPVRQKAVSNGSRKSTLPQAGTSRYQYRHGSLVRAKSRLKERKLKSMYRYYIHDDDPECCALRHRLVANMDQQQYAMESDGSSRLSIDDSLTSFSDIDDTDSMIMMMHATEEDDQASETAATIGPVAARGPTGKGLLGDDRCAEVVDGCEWVDELGSMDRSFSDVDSGRRKLAKRERRQRRRSMSARQQLSTSRCGVNSSGAVAAADKANFGGLIDGDANAIGSRGKLLSEASAWLDGSTTTTSDRLTLVIGLVTIVLLAIVLFALILPQVMIIKRLDLLETRLRSLDCDQMSKSKS